MLRRSSQAQANGRGPRPRFSPVLIGWAAAAVGLVVLALVVGRPGQEQDVQGATASPTASDSTPLAITFGTRLDAASGEIAGKTRRFHAGDTLAWAVTLPAAPADGAVLVQVVRLGGDQPEEVQPPSPQTLDAGSARVAVEIPAERLLALWGGGSYELRVLLAADGDPVARGTFTLLEAQ